MTWTSIAAKTDHTPAEYDCFPSIFSLVFVSTITLTVLFLEASPPEMAAVEPVTSFSLSVVAVSGYVSSAISAVDRERELLRRERNAFDQFVTEVKSITAATTAMSTGPTAVVESKDATESELCAPPKRLPHNSDECRSLRPGVRRGPNRERACGTVRGYCGGRCRRSSVFAAPQTGCDITVARSPFSARLNTTNDRHRTRFAHRRTVQYP